MRTTLAWLFAALYAVFVLNLATRPHDRPPRPWEHVLQVAMAAAALAIVSVPA